MLLRMAAIVIPQPPKMPTQTQVVSGKIEEHKAITLNAAGIILEELDVTTCWRHLLVMYYILYVDTCRHNHASCSNVQKEM